MVGTRRENSRDDPSSSDCELAAHALSQSLGLVADRIQPVRQQGSVNWTFRVEAGQTCVAVRINRQRNALMAHAEYAKERWCMDAVRYLGVVTPAVLAVGRCDIARG